MNTIHASPVVDFELLLVWDAAEHDNLSSREQGMNPDAGRMTYLEALDQVDCNRIACLTAKVADGHIRVQLTQPWQGCCGSGLSNIIGAQEELEDSISFCSKAYYCSVCTHLRAQILDGDGLRIEDCHRFHTGKDDILG